MAGDDLRIVVDAQIALAMFITARNRGGVSPKRSLLRVLTHPKIRWLWTPDIIDDYQKGADAIEADARLLRRAEFDRAGFQLFLAALQLSASVIVTVGALRDARRRISQAPRAAERDLEDAVYLACAVDGDAYLLASEDSDLRSLGSTYGGVRIVTWRELKEELTKHHLALN